MLHKPARVDLGARNTRMAWGAAKSMKLDLDEAEDRADDLAFNEIIWKSVKGADSPLPPPVRSAFVLPRPGRRERIKSLPLAPRRAEWHGDVRGAIPDGR